MAYFNMTMYAYTQINSDFYLYLKKFPMRCEYKWNPDFREESLIAPLSKSLFPIGSTLGSLFFDW